MPKILREEDISAGLRAPLYSITTHIPECNVCIYRIKPGECIPECNVCIYWDGPGKCKKLDDSPDVFGWGERHDCPDAVLNTESFQYPKYQELYPEECKVSAKK